MKFTDISPVVQFAEYTKFGKRGANIDRDMDKISYTYRFLIIDSGGFTLRTEVGDEVCGIRDYPGFRSLYHTGLNRFTVSHCGSRTPMPMLNPHLTASAPRLSTVCSLRFVGQGISPCCIT